MSEIPNVYDDLKDLFYKAWDTFPYHCLYTLIRVDWVHYGHFDTAVEIVEAVNDFSEIRKIIPPDDKKKNLRLDLLVYCHLTELSMPYEVIYNLIRCTEKDPYLPRPFVGQQHPINKIEKIRSYAKKTSYSKVTAHIDAFFSNDIRNAFSHSDYCITEDEFRIIEKQKYLKLVDVEQKLSGCFAFYNAFFSLFEGFKRTFRDFPKYHPQEDDACAILELLTNDELGLFGFNYHHSDKTMSSFYRLPDEVTGQNCRPLIEGGMILNWGEASGRTGKYMLDGKEVENIDDLKKVKCKDYNDYVKMHKYQKVKL